MITSKTLFQLMVTEEANLSYPLYSTAVLGLYLFQKQYLFQNKFQRTGLDPC